MPQYVRPGVYTRETDLSQAPRGPSTGACAIVGGATRGPVDQRTLVTDARTMVDLFGEPAPGGIHEGRDIGFGVHSALFALTGTNQVYFTRVIGEDGSYAGINFVDTGPTGFQSNDWTPNNPSVVYSSGGDPDFGVADEGTNRRFTVYARNPGAWGNNLSVRIGGWDRDENTFEITVYENVKGTSVERESFTVSEDYLKTDSVGKRLFIEDVINQRSRYIGVRYGRNDAGNVGDGEVYPGKIIKLPLDGNYAFGPATGIAYGTVVDADMNDAITFVGTGENPLGSDVFAITEVAIATTYTANADKSGITYTPIPNLIITKNSDGSFSFSALTDGDPDARPPEPGDPILKSGSGISAPDGNGARVVTLHFTTEGVAANALGTGTGTVDNGNGVRINYFKNSDYSSIIPGSSPEKTQTFLTPGEHGVHLSGGADGVSVGSPDLISEVVKGWDLYRDRDLTDISYLVNAGYIGSASGGNPSITLRGIAERRRDCMALIDTDPTQLSMRNSELVTWVRDNAPSQTSFAEVHAPWARIYDPYNDQQYDIPMSGIVAAIYSRTHFNREPWIAPAGFRNGTIDSGALQFVRLTNRYSEGELVPINRDRINAFQTVPGGGTVLMGQHTRLGGNSALSSVNVRYLVIVIERSARDYLRTLLFEQHTEALRLQVTENLNTMLSRIQAGFGVYAYNIQCDASNNTPGNEQSLYVDVWIQPTRAVEFIIFNTVITRSGVEIQSSVSNTTPQ